MCPPNIESLMVPPPPISKSLRGRWSFLANDLIVYFKWGEGEGGGRGGGPTSFLVNDHSETCSRLDNVNDDIRDRGATLRWGGGYINDSIFGGGGHKTPFLTNSI